MFSGGTRARQGERRLGVQGDARAGAEALFENLEGGATVDQFLEWFPGVTREQALTVHKFTESSLAAAAA
jgi:hypothetical protein